MLNVAKSQRDRNANTAPTPVDQSLEIGNPRAGASQMNRTAPQRLLSVPCQSMNRPYSAHERWPRQKLRQIAAGMTLTRDKETTQPLPSQCGQEQEMMWKRLQDSDDRPCGLNPSLVWKTLRNSMERTRPTSRSEQRSHLSGKAKNYEIGRTAQVPNYTSGDSIEFASYRPLSGHRREERKMRGRRKMVRSDGRNYVVAKYTSTFEMLRKATTFMTHAMSSA
jgi:hypothetical protein